VLALRRDVGQRLMRSALLPKVYEAAWRPVLFTAFSAGRDTADEDRAVARLLDPQPGESLLDVGCGPGNTTRRLARMRRATAPTVGLDASATMLARARRDTDDPRVSYVAGRAEALPFDDFSFDLVTCLGALYLMDDPHRALHELARVLRPGGRLAVLTTVLRGPLPLQLAAQVVTAPGGLRMFGAGEVAGTLGAAGLVGVRRELRGAFQLVDALRPA
jgi:ubiquinone/menaquinone biosynthesis C-methylase UbiE